MKVHGPEGPDKLRAKRRFLWPTVTPSSSSPSPSLPSPSLSPSQRHEVRMLPPSPSCLALDPRRRIPWVERARGKSTHRDPPRLYIIEPCTLALAALALALALATARGAHAAALAIAIAPRRRRRMLWVERARGKSRIAHTRLYTNPAHMRRPTRASHAPSLARALFHSLESLKNVPLYIFFHTAHTLPPHTLLPTVHTLSTPRLSPSYACMEAICYA